MVFSLSFSYSFLYAAKWTLSPFGWLQSAPSVFWNLVARAASDKTPRVLLWIVNLKK